MLHIFHMFSYNRGFDRTYFWVKYNTWDKISYWCKLTVYFGDAFISYGAVRVEQNVEKECESIVVICTALTVSIYFSVNKLGVK